MLKMLIIFENGSILFSLKHSIIVFFGVFILIFKYFFLFIKYF